MKKKIHYIIPPLLAMMALATANAQELKPVPKVVVNITIDRLRTDYMNAFLPVYGQDGFRRLMKEGRIYAHAEYPQSRLNRAACMATVQTGAVPYDHGIVSDTWLDRKTLRPVFCADDDAYDGVLTGDKSSPKFLGVSTVGDELKVATEGKAIVYAISPFRDAAIMGAGHAADGAFWINPLTGRWCGTSYYGPFPSWVSVADKKNDLDSYLSTTEWKPLSDLSGNFSYFISGGMKKPFSYKFKGDHRFAAFTTSGLVNEYVTKFVTECLNTSGIGNDDITDYLSITYYAGNYEHKPVSDFPMEMQDIYARLDKALGELIRAVEGKVGTGNALFVVTSTGYADTETADLAKYRVPTGTFYINRTAGLLNMYLMAIYGQGQYIEAFFGDELYLNHKLLEEKQLSLAEVMERCQELLLQSAGVKDVYTSQRLLLGAWTPGISRIRNSYNPKCSGDIMIQVAPGWHLMNEDSQDDQMVRESYVPFPIIFFGTDIKAENIDTPITTDYIAPTLSQVMRIRAPNACTTASLTGFSN
ncbi:MAG: alkaline phosphatase family protein [Bacteroidaceae bacterium]|nr:alkaline phosphatase family protein [Bacteroidaceae bacterium]